MPDLRSLLELRCRRSARPTTPSATSHTGATGGAAATASNRGVRSRHSGAAVASLRQAFGHIGTFLLRSDGTPP